MTQTKQKIEELTDRFRRNLDVYKNGAYNETQVRREFIDPFFDALGWDVANKAGFSNPSDKALNDKMVSLVDRMLDLNKKLQPARIAHEKELLEWQLKITDDQIDRLVYELYGLTEEEIKIIEP